MSGRQLLLILAITGFAPAASDAGGEIFQGLQARLSQKDTKDIQRGVGTLQEALRPIVASMPRNAHGRMTSSVVRYVLHRLFMQKGWSVRGLEPDGQSWSQGSPTEILEEGMPRQVLELFDAKLNEKGLDLEEAALLAATFNVVVRAETVQRLQAAFRAHFLTRSAALDEESAHRVLDTYAASYVMGQDVSQLSEWEIHGLEIRAARQWDNWKQLRHLMRDAKRSLLGEGTGNFSGLMQIVEEFGERFGRSENSECQSRKRDLLAIEHRGSGRVRLSEFYKANLHEGKQHFGESSNYLRQLGSLEESNPSDPQVIIPNYIASKSNCADPSKYFSVCCFNECDELLGQLEGAFGSPSATPSDIALLVAAMPSATVPKDRTLPASLLRRLQEVADENGGRVPLHGRLFAQWLHHAYPRECPFPHISGTTSPLRVNDWAAEPGNEVVANHEEMLQHIQAPRPQPRHQEEDEDGECAPWMDDEELLAPHADALTTPPQPLSVGSPWARIAGLALGTIALLAVARSAPALKTEVGFGLHSEKMPDQAVVYHV